MEKINLNLFFSAVLVKKTVEKINLNLFFLLFTLAPSYMSIYELFIFDFIFMHSNEMFAPELSVMIFRAREMFIENWTVHNFMHDILINQNLGGKIFIFLNGIFMP